MPNKPVITIDVSGLPCPAPLLGAKKILDDLQAGQTICMISDCSGTHDDLLAWCQYTGHVILSRTRQIGGKTAYLLCKTGHGRTTPIPHVTLDMRGVSCPGPILQAKKLLEGMKGGEVLQLVSDCTAAIDDIPLWSRQTSVELLLTLEMSSGVREFYLKRI